MKKQNNRPPKIKKRNRTINKKNTPQKSQNSSEPTKFKDIPLNDLFSIDDERYAFLRYQLNQFKEPLSDFSKGGAINPETLKDLMIVFSIIFSKMLDKNFTKTDEQWLIDFFSIYGNPKGVVKPKTLADFYSSLVMIETTKKELSIVPNLIEDWLDGEPVQYSAGYYLSGLFSSMYRLMILNEIADYDSLWDVLTNTR